MSCAGYGYGAVSKKTQVLIRINQKNGHKGTKTQNETICKNLSLCFGVLVAKMVCYKMHKNNYKILIKQGPNEDSNH
jgi:hypothetical protein